MSSVQPLPTHYLVTIRRLIRFALVGIAMGMVLGIVWTELRKTVQPSNPFVVGQDYAASAHTLEPGKGSRAQIALPPGVALDAGIDLKLAHGHTVLLLGLLPLSFAFLLHLSHVYGGTEIRKGTLQLAFWLYAVGSTGAVLLMAYKGWASFVEIRAGNFDFHAVDRGLFGGQRWLRGTCYGLSHTALAVGGFLFLGAVYKSTGGLSSQATAAQPVAAKPAPAQPAPAQPSAEPPAQPSEGAAEA